MFSEQSSMAMRKYRPISDHILEYRSCEAGLNHLQSLINFTEGKLVVQYKMGLAILFTHTRTVAVQLGSCSIKVQ